MMRFVFYYVFDLDPNSDVNEPKKRRMGNNWLFPMLHSNLEHWNLLVHPTESRIAREFQVTKHPVGYMLPLVTLPGCGIPATAMKLLSAELPPPNLGLGGAEQH